MDRKWNVLAVAVAIAGWFALGAMPAFAAVRCVNGGNSMCTPCNTDTDTTIQSAVTNAAPGDTVCVSAAVYQEQVVIDKPLTLQGAGMGPLCNDPGTTCIRPVSSVCNTMRFVSGDLTAAIVLVDGTTGVMVMDFTIDGTGGTTCSTGFVGIFYRGSSGFIENNHVTNISPGSSKALGIFVQTDKGGKTKADVAILNNMVDLYGKNGITADQAGTAVTVNGNTVTGDGMASVTVAQNGVQIGFAARGVVTGNMISNHFYVPTDFVACGALFFKAGSLGRAADNTFTLNEGNVCNVSGAVGSAHSPFND